jgi:hypothetical protein
MKWHACVCILLLTVASAGHAQGGPPYLTDDPGTPGPKRWEINLALTLDRRQAEYLLQAPDIDINYGVGNRIQLKYETAWSIAGVSGESKKSALGNSHFGIKWRFLARESAPLDVSTYPQFDFNPISSEEFGLLDRGSELLLPVEIARSFGHLDVDAEIGYKVAFGEPDSFIYGVIAAHSIGRVTAGAEIHGVASDDPSDDELVFNVGVVVELTRHHNLLASMGRSLRGSSAEPDLLAYLGVQLHLQSPKRRGVKEQPATR